MDDDHGRKRKSSAWRSPWTGGRVAWLVLPFFICLFVCQASYAQTSSSADSSEWRPYQVGLSASDLVTLFEGPEDSRKYQIYGRYRVTPHWALRTAVRYEHLVSDEQRLDAVVRTGVDYIFRDTERLQLYAGIDAVGGYDKSFNNDQTYRMGLSPTFGILVFVTDYLSFSVEPRLVAMYSYFDNPRNSPNAGEWSIKLEGNNLLIVSIHF